jgi:integrase
LPVRTRERLVAIELLPRDRIAAGKPLAEHLKDFEAHLRLTPNKRGTLNTHEHVELVMVRLRRVIDGCRFVVPADVDANKVLACLDRLRTGTGETPGLSAQTSNFYLQAIKQFCRWMAKERRLSENPVAHLSGLSVRLDRRHDRRNLDLAELQRLLAAAKGGPRTHGLDGPDRAMVYALAMASGFRAGELAVLSPASFDLDADPPTAALPAREDKGRRPVTQPLPPDVAEALRGYLAGKPAGAPLWPGYWSERAADMLKVDLAAARAGWIAEAEDPGERKRREESDTLVYEVQGPDGPLFADFHSLRHSYITLLERSGVSPKMAQQLARHSDIRQTMQRYTHATLLDLGAAVAACRPCCRNGRTKSARRPASPARMALRPAGYRPTRSAGRTRTRSRECLSWRPAWRFRSAFQRLWEALVDGRPNLLPRRAQTKTP